MANLAQDVASSSKVGKTRFHNPLLDWTAEIVEVTTPIGTKVSELRKRDVNVMHCNKIKENTVASIKIVKENTSIDATDNFRDSFFSDSSDNTDVLFESTNFVLQASGEADSEKSQIMDNFGELPQIFFFGRRPRVYSYSGMLWNNDTNNWKDEFRYVYNKYLRGTKCVENGVKLILTYDRSVRLGYMLQMNINQNAEMEMSVPINFAMFIEDEKELIDLDNTEIVDAFKLVNENADTIKKSILDKKIEIQEEVNVVEPETDKNKQEVSNNALEVHGPKLGPKNPIVQSALQAANASSPAESTAVGVPTEGQVKAGIYQIKASGDPEPSKQFKVINLNDVTEDSNPYKDTNAKENKYIQNMIQEKLNTPKLNSYAQPETQIPFDKSTNSGGATGSWK